MGKYKKILKTILLHKKSIPQESLEDEGNHKDIYFQSDYGRNQNENNQLENLKK